MTLAMTPKQ